MEELLDEVYNETIDIVLNGIDEKDIEEVKKEYKDYLIDKYSTNIDTISDTKLFVNVVIDIEKNKWENKSSVEKKMKLTVDYPFEKILTISGFAYNNAKRRSENNDNNQTISQEDANKYMKELRSLLATVKEYNREVANKCVYDASMNLLYAANLDNSVSRFADKKR